MTPCPRCGREKKPAFRLCWKCANNDRLRDEYERGYEQGRADQRAAVLTRFPQLVQLVHPDRHGNSPLSNDVTTWLLELRRGAA